jgi:hypothetical protein
LLNYPSGSLKLFLGVNDRYAGEKDDKETMHISMEACYKVEPDRRRVINSGISTMDKGVAYGFWRIREYLHFKPLPGGQRFQTHYLSLPKEQL